MILAMITVTLQLRFEMEDTMLTDLDDFNHHES